MDIPKIVEDLEKLTQAAEAFVTKHFPTEDQKGRNIKILAVVNQMIELERLDVERNRVPKLSESLVKYLTDPLVGAAARSQNGRDTKATQK